MEAPYTDPVGLSVVPADYVRSPRRYPVGIRLFAAFTLGAFVAVASVTTAVSLGAYCLTSDAGNAAALPPRAAPGSQG